jgi:NAD(P)-dependent dehydrogenase (short-subunit alcohol dehydrogenase family)
MSKAVIVGGSSGIGLATARQLAERNGWGDPVEVHVVGRNQARLDAAASDPRLHAHQADGSDAASIGAVLAALAPVDILIVSLASSEGLGPLAALDLDMLRRAFDAKFWGHITTVQAALPHLSPTASITLVGAISARTGMPGSAGIAAINGAVEALVQPLAAELAPRRVNAVSPGVVDTPWWEFLPDGARQDFFTQTAKSLPTGKIATADDIAEAVVLLATNPNLTGTVLESDGGARLISLG